MIRKRHNNLNAKLVCFTFCLGLTAFLIPLSEALPGIDGGTHSFSIDEIQFTNIEKTILTETIPDIGVPELSIPPIPVLPISTATPEITAIRLTSTKSDNKYIIDLPSGASVRHSILLAQDRGDFIVLSGKTYDPNCLHSALFVKGWKCMTNDKESINGTSSWIYENKIYENLLVLEKTGDFFVVRRTKSSR